MKKNQIKLIIIALVVIAAGAGLLLSISSESMTYYYTPSEVMAAPADYQTKTIRIMGQVAPDSVQWKPATTELSFDITETGSEVVRIVYYGAKPDMFRENQGVVAEGKMSSSGLFKADKLLVKHSEEYKVEEQPNGKEKDYHKTLQ